MTTNEKKATITQAISDSIAEDRIVYITAELGDAETVAAALGYHTDSVEIECGVDFWGWTAHTPDDDSDFRLRLAN